MRVLYIANSRIPTEKAHGYQIAKMCEVFSTRGTEVDLILPTRKNPDFDQTNIYEHYGLHKNFNVVYIKTLDPVLLLKFPAGLYIKVLFFFFKKSLKRYLNRQSVEKDTLLYTRDQYLIPLLLKYSKNVIWEAHDLPRKKIKYASCWKKCSRIITITQGLKEQLVALRLAKENILVAPDGVDLKIFSRSTTPQSHSINIPRNKKIIMYAGHLYGWKGAYLLAQAASLLDDGVMVVFVGGTDNDIVRFKEQYGKHKKILIIGRVEHHLVPAYLNAAHVLVLPNSGQSMISSQYTSPLKMFEYMACGKPIVASNLPSIREILNNRNAVLVEPDNETDLARGIKKLLSDPMLAQSLAQEAYRDVQQYSWESRAQNILNFVKIDIRDQI